jgi:hypothetical protein
VDGGNEHVQLVLDDGPLVVVLRGGIRVEFNAGGGIDVYGNVPVTMHHAANDAVKSTTRAGLQPGDPDDGGVYVGTSPTTGLPLHAALADEPRYLSFEGALEAAEIMRSQPGRENTHVPSPEELNILYQNRDRGALRRTFQTRGSTPDGCYRSSAAWDDLDAQVQWFGDGAQGRHDRNTRLPVRLVW